MDDFEKALVTPGHNRLKKSASKVRLALRLTRHINNQSSDTREQSEQGRRVPSGPSSTVTVDDTLLHLKDVDVESSEAVGALDDLGVLDTHWHAGR